MTRYGCSQNSAFKNDAALSVQMMTFTAQVASAAGVDRKQVESVLKAMQGVLMAGLEKDGKVRIPGFFAAKAHVKPEKPACKKVVFGKTVDLPHKPSVKIVRMMPCKKLRLLS